MPPYEMLYGRKCCTLICWGEISEKELGGSDLVLKTNEKIEVIRERLKEAQDRQNHMRIDVGDQLSLRKVTWKCLTAQSTIMPLEEVEVNDKLGYIEESVDIAVEQKRKIRNNPSNCLK
ncbi:uncharacterized protein [Rutidosis leptorrhynchoides]|uniref:uncharacterized protein n=1 Tax=Rutidosis leptorrhynchoides TaxID=125765 RepID=UPI003A99D636